MLKQPSNTVAAVRWIAVALAMQLLMGCMAQSRGNFDIDRTPIVNTGSRASILYPGQGAPAMPGSAPPGYHPPAGATQPGVPAGAGAPPPQGQPAPGTAPPPESGVAPQPNAQSGGEMTFLGGARQDERRHLDVREDPLIVKYLTAPIALLAAPFVLAKEALTDEPEPGPPIPQRKEPTLPQSPRVSAPAPQSTDYETAMLQRMERELEQRRELERNTAESAPQPATSRAPSPSIADELEALQRSPEIPRSSPDRTGDDSSADPVGRSAAATADRRAAADDPYPTAHGIVDRNQDGRIDQWIFREDGEIVREVLDEDFDGRPDRTIVFDRETHRPSRVEEDTTGDGALDSWTEYRDGEIVRRRSDSAGDGVVDTWSFYREGVLARHEQDTTGDGFRDAVSYFENGNRVREERDRDGDGLADTVLYYDGSQQLTRQEEDRNGDGNLDVVSHYQSGRLVRREVLDPTEATR